MKIKDFKTGEIYEIENASVYVSKVIDVNTTVTFKDISGDIINEEWALFEDSLKHYKFKKLNKKQHPEYFL